MASTSVPSAGCRDATARAARHGARGQSIVELAILLPLLLAFLGIVGDVARITQAWIDLQGATRLAAETIASDSAYSFASQARPRVEAIVCGEMVGTTTCPAGVRVTVSLDLGTIAATGAGAWRSSVAAEYDFRSFLVYPFIAGITGADSWTIRAASTFDVIRKPRF